MIQRLLNIALLLLCCQYLSSQEVSISPELNLRNYFSYHLLGDVDGKSIVFRDRGYVKEVDVFNKDLELVQSAELFLEKRRVDIFNVMELDTSFQLLYGYFENDSMVFNYRMYNNRVELVDSFSFLRLDKSNIRKKIGTSVSDDKNRILFTTIDDEENMVFLLFNNTTKYLEWSSKIKVDGNVRNSLYSIVLANNGDFIVSLSANEWSDRPKASSFLVVSPRLASHQYVSFANLDYKLDNLTVRCDNKNFKWLICGTYSSSKESEAKGYFYTLKQTEDFQITESFNLLAFDPKLYQELLQGKKRKSRVFEDITIKDVLFRNDGGFAIISEIQREYARRNPYNGYSRTSYDNYTSRRAWIDYYNEDIIISNVSPDGSMMWNRVLYKKQFSQDDDGIYSSFFVMKSPSRLRFIYNDEIKRNNTVSEYLMDPAGKVARNSLLSTAYHKMKLRFKDAIQISPNTLIVPSERSYDLNLVRITY